MKVEWQLTEGAWPVRGTFRIARGARTVAETLQLEIRCGEHAGRAECVPYKRYGESRESSASEIESALSNFGRLPTRMEIQTAMSAGAARNAVDCALWDLESKMTGRPVWQIAGLLAPQPVTTAFTLSVASPDEMAEKARSVAQWPLLKLKLDGMDDVARVRAVRQARQDARLIVDANEAWPEDQVAALAMELAWLGVDVIEQPLPASDDMSLPQLSGIDICADESIHGLSSLDKLNPHYTMINIKLDKTGGLTEALQLARTAQTRGLRLMVGCMLGSSLAMAPALLLAQMAQIVDLDGPLLLEQDYSPSLLFKPPLVYPPQFELWG